jgi:hypothetical protein
VSGRLARSLSQGAAGLGLGVALTCLPRAASAACGDVAAVTSACQLDLVTSPVLSSGRIVALGGAYEALGEGTDGYAMNAAAPALRAPWSNGWVDYDIDASITFPSAFKQVDFENRGYITPFTYKDFYFLTLGANLQLGAWGFGVVSDLQHYNLSPDARADQEKFGATISRTHALLARSLFGGDLVVGGGLRIIGFDISRTLNGATTSVVSLSGAAPELGVLIRPEGLPFRLGGTLRAPVTTARPGGDQATSVGGLVAPGSAHLPWEVDLGVALQGGPRPLNPNWVNPHDDEADLRTEIRLARERRARERAKAVGQAAPADRAKVEQELDARDKKLRVEEDAEATRFRSEVKALRKQRYRALGREYVLLTLGLLVTGSTDEGISLESYFAQTVTRAGRNATFSVRAGVETELIPGQLKLRLGSYIEPTRFGSEPDAKAFRQHVTGGFEAELFTWSFFHLLDDDTQWRLNTMLDLAPRWSNYGLSIGFWH